MSDQKDLAEQNAFHIETINDELGEIWVVLAQIETNLKWVMKLLWVVLTAAGGAFVTGIVRLVSGGL